MSNPEYDWESIEVEITARAESLEPHRKKKFLHSVYRPANWLRVGSRTDKAACACCGALLSDMFTYQETGCPLPEPLSLCEEHYRAWKTDPRTSKRLSEIKAETEQKMRENLSQGRTRDPAGWHLDAADALDEINALLKKPVPCPDIKSMDPKKALDTLKQIQKSRDVIINEIASLTTE